MAQLVAAVEALAYDDASLTVTMTADGWSVGLDTGEKVDDVLEWAGDDLAALLVAALDALAPREVRAPVRPARDDDLAAALSALAALRPSAGRVGVDLAFVPRSMVTGGRAWEIVCDVSGEQTVWLGDDVGRLAAECLAAVRAAGPPA